MKKPVDSAPIAERAVLEEIVVPFLRDDLGYILVDPRLQRVPVRFGRETKYADAVVYVIEKAKRVPHIVVETKRPGASLDWLQAESYAQRLGAPYFLVTDGKLWYWYRTGRRQGESTRIQKAPQPPPEAIEALVTFEDLNELSRIVGQSHDVIRSEEGFDPTVSFDEISKLMFAKMQDEREVEQGYRDDDQHTPKSEYEFRATKDALPEEVAEHVIALFERAKTAFPEIFEATSEDIRSLKLRNNTIRGLVRILQGYNLRETPIDVKGATYEAVIKGTFTGKGLGQFFTPREVVEFMVDMVEPKRRHLILDPACGSGGFLIVCMSRVWDQIDDLYRRRGLDNPKREKHRFATRNLFGVDINERMSWVAKMNMVMHGDGHGGIFQHDAFRITERIQPILDIVERRGGFDMVLTNPPFGGKIRNQDILTRLELGQDRKSQLTEVLFVELCLRHVRPEGIVGIIVPDGVLSKRTLEYVREYIDRQAIWLAVVSLPDETFVPYGSGVKASIIFLQKRDLASQIRQGDVFMAEAQHIGYDPTGRATRQNDLPTIANLYHRERPK